MKNENKSTPETDADKHETTTAKEELSMTAEPSIEEQLDAARKELATVKDQLLRKVAEFENYRRRVREEQSSIVQFATEGLIRDLLPLLDDFGRSLNAGKEHTDFDSFYKGVEFIRNKLFKTLEQRGLKPIVASGQPFDVEFHEALLQVPTPDVEPGTVLDEVEQGYMLHQRVLRHSKVTVATELHESPSTPTEGNGAPTT